MTPNSSNFAPLSSANFCATTTIISMSQTTGFILVAKPRKAQVLDLHQTAALVKHKLIPVLCLCIQSINGQTRFILPQEIQQRKITTLSTYNIRKSMTGLCSEMKTYFLDEFTPSQDNLDILIHRKYRVFSEFY